MRIAFEDHELADQIEALGVPGLSDVWPEAIRDRLETHEGVREEMDKVLNSLWRELDAITEDEDMENEFSDAEWADLGVKRRTVQVLRRYMAVCPG